MNIKTLLAERTKDMDASAIREILKVVSRPGMVSLAGGIPAPESFPMESLEETLQQHRVKFIYLEDHLPLIIALYRPKQEAMLAALDRYFPSDFSWSRPEGGMFLWAEGPAGLDMEKLYYKAIEANVAFVPGKFFFTDPAEGHETMRLNYTMADEPTIARAIKTLAQVIGKYRDDCQTTKEI